MSKKSIKWRTIIGLVLVYLAFLLNLNWLWGLLFLIWVIPDLKNGVSYFMEPVYKAEQPVLYWLIMASWLLISFYLMATLLFPGLNYT